jgi:hypothetical protein
MRRHKNPDDWRPLMTEVIGGIWEAQAAYRLRPRTAYGAEAGQAHSARLHEQEPAEDNRGQAEERVHLRFEPAVPQLRVPLGGALQKTGQLRALPSWSDAVVNDLMAKHAADPRNLKWQHRLYALSLFATVVSKRREVPLATEGAR